MLHLPESWVWDSWFAFDGELHHAFYLRASRALGQPERRHRYPYIGHSISRDLQHWETVTDALAISDSPAFDSWTTWTGSVVRASNGLWWMFYTGTSREDSGDQQRIGAATSRDLYSWTKLGSKALVQADGAIYELLDYEKWHDEAWRDPWVFEDGGLWHMLITARDLKGERDSRGVVGYAISQDLQNWEVQRPLTETNSGFGHMEVNQVEVVNGYPTLLWCCGFEHLSKSSQDKYGSGGMFSCVGESKLGPFKVSEAIRFPHQSIYAARLVEHRKQWFLIGFRGYEDGKFIGELTDRIPVTNKGRGLEPA